jgi:hypothetical protein
MPVFPTSTGNFIFTLNTNDNFDFYLQSSGAPINLTSTVIAMNFRHSQIMTDVKSFITSASSPRLSITNASSGAVRFNPFSGDFSITGDYDYKFKIWDSSSNVNNVPEHFRYTCTILDDF